MNIQEKLIKEITIVDNKIILLDHIVNHQINLDLIKDIAKEIISHFEDEKIDKIFTIETGGIPISMLIALELNVNIVYAKKGNASNMKDYCYVNTVHSYTKNITNTIRVDKNYLSEGENVLIIDDFLATGAAINAMMEICGEARCNVVGAGFIVNKRFQNKLDSSLNIKSVLDVLDIKNNELILE